MVKNNQPVGKREAMQERRVKAFEFRKAGYSLREIGDKLGVSHETIREDLDAVLTNLVKQQLDNADQYRAMELERLDAMLKALWPFVQAGSAGAVDTALKIAARRSKLLGLDAPVKQDIKVDLTKLSDEQLQALAEGKAL